MLVAMMYDNIDIYRDRKNTVMASVVRKTLLSKLGVSKDDPGIIYNFW